MAKRLLVGFGGRALFYPTLLVNLARYKMESDFNWWDRVDEFILLGAVPFQRDVPRLKQLGVGAVITLNESFETLVPSSLYKDHGIDHLVIPTRDYLYAPSVLDIDRAVDLIHRNASQGKITYVHCKAGRGRSTTIVLCYLVKYRNMTPSAAYEYVQTRRPRVKLHQSQLKAVEEYSKREHECPATCHPKTRSSFTGDEEVTAAGDLQVFNSKIEQKLSISTRKETGFMINSNGDVDIITKADLEGYDASVKAPGDMSNSNGDAQNGPRKRSNWCFFSFKAKQLDDYS